MKKRTHRDALWIGSFALLLRLIYVLAATPTPVIYGDDPWVYERTAQVLNVEDHHDEFWDYVAGFNPGYPIFLATIYEIFPDRRVAVRLVQALLDAISCSILYLIGCRLAGREVGIIAGMLMSLYVPLILMTGKIRSETLGLFFFVLSILLLLVSLRRSSVRWCIAAACVAALSALTRTTITATVPLFALAILIYPKRMHVAKRGLLAFSYSLFLVMILTTWNRTMVSHLPTDAEVVVGTRGFHHLKTAYIKAAAPVNRGWRSYGVTVGRWYGEMLNRDALYPFFAAGNLFFYHSWFANNIWQESFFDFFDSSVFHVQHRIVMILALAGIGISLLRFRRWSLVLSAVAGYCILSLKFIELRHNLLHMPIFFLLAAFAVKKILCWIKRHDDHTLPRIKMISLGWFFLFALVLTGRFAGVTLYPWIHPAVAGLVADFGTYVLAISGFGLLYFLASRCMSSHRALIISVLPMVTLVFLFASYQAVVSEPRWRSDVMALESEVEQILIMDPIPKGTVKRSFWLIDLTSFDPKPPIQAMVHGEPIATEIVNVVEHFAENYGGGERGGRILTSWPQWWRLHINPGEVEGRSEISLRLRERPSWEAGREPVKVGASFGFAEPEMYYGPSMKDIGGPEYRFQMLYFRWIVAGDWRIWETTELNSLSAHGRIGPPAVTPRPGDRSTVTVHGRRRYGNLGIRLYVELKDGETRVY